MSESPLTEGIEEKGTLSNGNGSDNADNYKGVLLSNRPHSRLTQGISPAPQNGFPSSVHDDRGAKAPFIPSGSWQHTPLGLPPSREQLEKIQMSNTLVEGTLASSSIHWAFKSNY